MFFLKKIFIMSILLPTLSLAQNCNTSIPATTPTNQFKDNGDGTVTDNKTGLMWQKCSEGQTGNTCEGLPLTYTFENALQQQITKNSRNLLNYFMGYKDWRLPNNKELLSIIEEQCAKPAINLSVFPNTVAQTYWSNTIFADDISSVWDINFGEGDSYISNRGQNLVIRLVRGRR